MLLTNLAPKVDVIQSHQAIQVVGEKAVNNKDLQLWVHVMKGFSLEEYFNIADSLFSTIATVIIARGLP